MARRSLKPQLNQIRTWVRQGRTDAWIAHQLEVSVGRHPLLQARARARARRGRRTATAARRRRLDEELDLRAEDDALVAAALEAEQEADDERGRRGRATATATRTTTRTTATARAAGAGAAAVAAAAPHAAQPLEGTFDHGDEGYGLWLDPAIQDDPVYAEHWAGHRPVTVTVEAERIVISRAGEEADDGLRRRRAGRR